MADLRPVDFTLSLRDNGDTQVDTRWTDSDGTPYAIASAAAQVRATEGAADPALVEATVELLGAPDHWVRFTFSAADVTTANFEALDPDEPAYWDCTLTRVSDSKTLVPLAGRVRWNQGVTR